MFAITLDSDKYYWCKLFQKVFYVNINNNSVGFFTVAAVFFLYIFFFGFVFCFCFFSTCIFMVFFTQN